MRRDRRQAPDPLHAGALHEGRSEAPRPDAHDSCSSAAESPGAARPMRAAGRVRSPRAMPSTPTQLLAFMLGLLLSFYLLVPFLERGVR